MDSSYLHLAVDLPAALDLSAHIQALSGPNTRDALRSSEPVTSDRANGSACDPDLDIMDAFDLYDDGELSFGNMLFLAVDDDEPDDF